MRKLTVHEKINARSKMRSLGWGYKRLLVADTRDMMFMAARCFRRGLVDAVKAPRFV